MNIIFPPKTLLLVDTGVCVHLPKGTYGRIADRSSMVLFNRIHVLGGVVDSDYRGSIRVMLYNFGTSSCTIDKGQKIAQMIVTKIQICTLQHSNVGHYYYYYYYYH